MNGRSLICLCNQTAEVSQFTKILIFIAKTLQMREKSLKITHCDFI